MPEIASPTRHRGEPTPDVSPATAEVPDRAARPQRTRKALRVALVMGGCIVEERVLARGKPATVGSTERALFVVAHAALPPAFRVVEYDGRGLTLSWLDGMSGRVASPSGTLDLATLEKEASQMHLNGRAVYRVALDEDARGRIVVGDAALLFQVVAQPEAPPNAALPPSARLRLEDRVDWRTTLIASMSFLLHFGAVGAIYSDWGDPIVDDAFEAQQVIEAVHDLPATPPLETPNADEARSVGATAASRPTGEGQSAATKSASQTGGGAKMSDARAHAIAAEMAAIDQEVVGALAGRGPATDDVLRSGNVPMGALERLGASERGAGRGDGTGLHLAEGGGTVRPGERSSIRDLGETASRAPESSGARKDVTPPKARVATEGTFANGNVPNAAAVIASLRGGLRACYQHGLDDNPSMRGSVRITARVAPNGEVTSATPSGGSGLSAAVIGCVSRVIGSAQFASPTGGGAIVVVPILFEAQ